MKALVLVPYGSSCSEAVEQYPRVAQYWQRRFPDRILRWAWSSRVLCSRNYPWGHPPLLAVLHSLAQEGVVDVFVQSLHLVGGSEFATVQEQSLRWGREGRSIAVGSPLMGLPEHGIKLARLLEEEDGGDDTQRLYCGHGSSDPVAQELYHSLDAALQALERPAYLALLESAPGMGLSECLRSIGNQSTVVYPFLLVCGWHWYSDVLKINANEDAAQFLAFSEKSLALRPSILQWWASRGII